MDIEYSHVSAFADVPGRGNSAAVCSFAQWPTDRQLSLIARTIGLPVTACIVQSARGIELRWLSRAGTFIQSMCGHGTLAASCVVALERPDLGEFTFRTTGGEVPVLRRGRLFELALPRWNSKRVQADPLLVEALGGVPTEIHDAGRDMIAVYGSEQEVHAANPNMDKLRAYGHRGFIVTAAGKEFDCVSRFFCPSFGLGVDEDPVTGSAHCSIIPLWAEKLGKQRLRAYQASSVGGELRCELTADSVAISAPAVVFARARVTVEDV